MAFSFKRQSLAFIAFFGLASPVLSQAVAPVVPENLIAAPGQTISINIQSGSRASLSVGSSTSFGTSASINAMDGYSVESTATLNPGKGSISTTMGISPELGVIEAEITNVRATGTGTFETNSAGSTATIEGNENSQFSEASTKLKGMTTEFDLELDEEKENSFITTIKKDGGNESSAESDGDDNSEIPINNSSGSASASTSNMMNVDMSNTSFSTSFSQNF